MSLSDKRIILHIGAGKTGTSAIQMFLRRNAVALAEAGYVVPDQNLGLEGKITGEHVWKLESMLGNADPNGVKEALINLVERIPDDAKLLLSAENMSNLGNHRSFKGLADLAPTQAILYIRRQDDLLMSAWQQWHVKVESDFQAWLIRALRIYGQWERIIEDWEGVLGTGAVTVRVFERSAFVRNDLLADFADSVGIGHLADSLEFSVGRVNASMNDVVTSVVQGSRSLFTDTHDNGYYNFVERVLGDSMASQKKLSLVSKLQRESIIGHYSTMNRRIAARFFPERPNLFAPVDHDQYEYLSGDDLTIRQIRFLNELIYAAYKRERAGK